MSSIDCLNCNFFCNLKLYIKYKFIDHIVNNIWLMQNFTYVLKSKEHTIQRLDFQNI